MLKMLKAKFEKMFSNQEEINQLKKEIETIRLFDIDDLKEEINDLKFELELKEENFVNYDEYEELKDYTEELASVDYVDEQNEEFNNWYNDLERTVNGVQKDIQDLQDDFIDIGTGSEIKELRTELHELEDTLKEELAMLKKKIEKQELRKKSRRRTTRR